MNVRQFTEIRDLLLHRLPPLHPHGVFREDLTAAIEALSAPPLVEAGLHLLNDDLERCHRIAQAHEGPDGNYWHAILHRREGDFGNSLYWYRRVGEHPVLAAMAAVFPSWTFGRFVSWCEEADEGNPRDGLERMQLAEMRFLLESLG